MLTLSVLAALLGVAGCSQREANKQQLEAQKTFDEAFKQMALATSGTRDVKLAEDSQTLEQFRQQKLKDVAKQLQPLTSQGPPAQKLAALSLIAETYASQARLLARSASAAWPQQTALGSALLSDASSIRVAQTIAAEHNKVNHDKYLAGLRDHEKQLVSQQDQLATELAAQRKAVETLSGKEQTASETRKTKIAEAEKLNRQAFSAEGQAQYDLYIKAAGATREADRLSAEADTAAAKLSIEQAQLRVLEKRHENTQQLLAEVREAIKQAEQRASDTRDMATKSEQRATQLAESFNAKFKTLVTQQAEQVDQPFTEALEQYEQSLNKLEAAKAVAPPAARQATELDLAGIRAEMGQVHQQQALIADAYSQLLSSLAKTTEPLEQLHGPTAEAASSASARSSKANSAAQDTLTTALEQLNTVAESGDKGAKVAALEQLVQVNLALAIVTENDQYKAAADQARAKLNAAKAE